MNGVRVQAKFGFLDAHQWLTAWIQQNGQNTEKLERAVGEPERRARIVQTFLNDVHAQDPRIQPRAHSFEARTKLFQVYVDSADTPVEFHFLENHGEISTTVF